MSGVFIKHGSCESCGSKDNVAWYEQSDGTVDGTCFGCKAYYKKKKRLDKEKKMVDYINIPETVNIEDLMPKDFQALYKYRDTNNNLLFCVARTDSLKALPVAWDGNKIVYKKRNIKALYNAESLSDNKSILIVEGEKCVEAAKIKAPKLTPITWQGGCNNVSSGDWDLLENKTVYIWPDNDNPGHTAAKEIISLLPDCNVYLLEVSHLALKADIADDLTDAEIVKCFSKKQLIKEYEAKPGRCKMSDIHTDIQDYKDSFLDIELDGEKFTSLKVPGISVIEGRSGHGKTTLMLNMALNLLSKGIHVAIFNYEMTSTEVFTRMLMASRGEQLDIDNGINFGRYIEDVRDLESEEAKTLSKYLDDGLLDIFGSDSSVLYDSNKIIKFIDKYCTNESLVLIDYIQILPTDSAYNVPQYKVIKDLVYGILPSVSKNKTHVMFGSQLTGEGMDTIFDSPRESKDITNVSSLSLRVWNKSSPVHRKLEERYSEDSKESRIPPYYKESGDFIVECSKNRWGKHFIKSFYLQAGSKLMKINKSNELTNVVNNGIINNTRNLPF